MPETDGSSALADPPPASNVRVSAAGELTVDVDITDPETGAFLGTLQRPAWEARADQDSLMPAHVGVDLGGTAQASYTFEALVAQTGLPPTTREVVVPVAPDVRAWTTDVASSTAATFETLTVRPGQVLTKFYDPYAGTSWKVGYLKTAAAVKTAAYARKYQSLWLNTTATTNVATTVRNTADWYADDTFIGWYQNSGWNSDWSYGTAPAPALTPEQVALQAERYKKERAKQLAAAKREAKRRAAAKERAVTLLKEHLTDAEHQQLDESGYFEVRSTTTGNLYRVYRGFSRNVVRLDERGVPVERLCAHGGYGSGMPDEDHMLAQKLYLESLETEFRKIANISRIGAVEAQQILAGRSSAHVVDALPRVLLPLAA